MSGRSAAVCPGDSAATMSGHVGLQVGVMKKVGHPSLRANSIASVRRRRKWRGEPGTLLGR
eukprot:9469331-Pyramimonas_sp.AAC.1